MTEADMGAMLGDMTGKGALAQEAALTDAAPLDPSVHKSHFVKL